MTAAMAGQWGTWQQLVLGGAVLRHGAADWNSVAAEMRCRFSYPFSPQECEAKYADVQERFSDFCSWFETIRKQRAKELKMELAESEGSIGFLQLKLEYLARAAKAGREETSRLSDSSPCTGESAEEIDLSNREPFNDDRSSVGSFIDEVGSGCSPASSTKKEKEKEEGSPRSFNGDTPSMPGSLRRKRGARKRRFQGQEEYLEGILDAIAGDLQISLFRHRLDSQKRSGYRKMIRRHADLETVRSGIRDGTISSAEEVFRELLLICNNALVFFPKRSPEHEAALVLRKLVAERRSKEKSTVMEERPEKLYGEVVVMKRRRGERRKMSSKMGSSVESKKI